MRCMSLFLYEVVPPVGEMRSKTLVEMKVNVSKPRLEGLAMV